MVEHKVEIEVRVLEVGRIGSQSPLGGLGTKTQDGERMLFGQSVICMCLTSYDIFEWTVVTIFWDLGWESSSQSALCSDNYL